MMEEETAVSYWVWRLMKREKVMSKMIDVFSYKLSSSFYVCTELYDRSIQAYLQAPSWAIQVRSLMALGLVYNQ